MNLLQICQAAADRAGTTQPTSIVGSAESEARMLLQFANEEGRELVRTHTWNFLITETSFTTVATETQTTLPTDFSWYLESSMYNRTQNRPVIGPLTPQRWQQLRSLLVSSIWDAFRIRGNSILFNPTPTAGDSIYYEYVSSYWCRSAGDSSNDQDEYVADTDVTDFDGELMILGVTWRRLAREGYDYAEAFRKYEERKAWLISNDLGQGIVDLSGDDRAATVFDPYVPDSGWSLP